MTTKTATQAAGPIARDIQNVVDDTQELLKSVEREGMAKVGQARTRLDESIAAARARFAELGTQAQERARMASAQTDEYVHAHPWEAVGMGAAFGALVGFLIARR